MGSRLSYEAILLIGALGKLAQPGFGLLPQKGATIGEVTVISRIRMHRTGRRSVAHPFT